MNYGHIHSPVFPPTSPRSSLTFSLLNFMSSSFSSKKKKATQYVQLVLPAHDQHFKFSFV